MSFNEYMVQMVWEKGVIVPGYDSSVWRKDTCGAWICRSFYGNREASYGWEIDHIKPSACGGGDNLDNLRPLQWQNNASRQDDGGLFCIVTAR
ncbi:MAG: HNH endonuclease [Candidatus Omnitrophica bacterium]|jgi:5-methylcytosine-specific restriction endonuclease McrA|nr:HNH endonuclease [Candidatus Omnitrophota bacterium]